MEEWTFIVKMSSLWSFVTGATETGKFFIISPKLKEQWVIWLKNLICLHGRLKILWKENCQLLICIRLFEIPMDCSPARLLRPWNSPGKNTGVGCHSFLQGNFLTQGSNPGLRHCRQILYCSSHQGNHLSQQRSHCGRKHRRYLRVTIRKSFLSACS